MTADDLSARVAALAARMRAGPVPGASVPAVPASKSRPGQEKSDNNNYVPPVPAVPAKNGKADLSRAVPTAEQDRTSSWCSASGPFEADPTRNVERTPTAERPPPDVIEMEHSAEHEAERWRDEFEERSAIREHEGGLSPEEAEAATIGDLALRWRSAHPLAASRPTDPCTYCNELMSKHDRTSVPARDGHAWLHRQCRKPMDAAREKLAREAIIEALGIANAVALETTDAAIGGGDTRST